MVFRASDSADRFARSPENMHPSQQQHPVVTPMQRAQGQPEAPAFDPWIIWVTIRRCWYWAVPTGLVLACLGTLYVLKSFVPRYQASYLLEANNDYLVFKGVMPTVSDLARSEKSLIMSPIVLERVLRDPELVNAPSLSDPDKAESNLRKNLSIAGTGSRSQLRISYTDTDREAAADVCNAVASSYLKQRDTFDTQRVNNLQKWLEPEIDRWEQEVAIRRDKVRELSKATHGMDLEDPLDVQDDRAAMSQIARLRGEITELELRLKLLDAEIAEGVPEFDRSEFDSGEDYVPEFIAPAIEVTRPEVTQSQVRELASQDPGVIEANSRMARYKERAIQMEDNDLKRINQAYYEEQLRKRDEWETTLNERMQVAMEEAQATLEDRADREYERRLKQREAEIEVQRREFLAKSKKEQQREIVMQQQALEEEYERKVQEREEAQVKLEILREQYQKERQEMERYGSDTADLQFAQQELEVANEVLQKLRVRKTAIGTEKGQEGAVRTLAEAKPPSYPLEDVPFKKLVMAGGAGFAVPFFIGFLLEFRAKRVTDSQKLEKSHSIAPLVGELAKAPSVNAGRGSRGRRVFEESVDTMRANLFFSKETRDARSFAIVSSMSGEGKSTAASQLGISLAKASGKTVLLIDADMRCPDQHDVFGLSLDPGLSGVLTGKATLTEAIETELGDLIHVLPAGKLRASPHRLMSPTAMRSLMDEALEHYEYVIVDTAPVLSAGETLAVASSVDATLVCVMRDVTRMDSVERTTHRLVSAGANVAGTIFSGVTHRQYAYRYGDYNYTNMIESISEAS
jgi:capsular exopolysaccharide synthesis family protein